MKKILLYILIVCSCSSNVFGQKSSEEINELKYQLRHASNDSTRGRMTYLLAYSYRFSNIDSSLFYTDLAIGLADKRNLPTIKAQLLSLKGATVLEAGKLPESLRFQFEALEISEKAKDTTIIAYALNRIGNIYMELADYKKANEYYFRSKDLFEKLKNTGMYYNEISNIGNVYELMNKPDSALHFLQEVYNATENKMVVQNFITLSELMFRMGNVFKSKGNNVKAMDFYKRGINEAIKANDIRNLTMNNLLLAKLYDEQNMLDSCTKYAYNAFQTGKAVSFRKGVYDASELLSRLYKERNLMDSAYKYLNIASVEKDSLSGAKRLQELQTIILNEQERERNAELVNIAESNKQKLMALLAGLAVFLVITSILYFNNKQKQNRNKILASTLHELQSTQSQLIQSEKMASLGELTAGIAHEIQNPLNFVNNFSEVSNELIDEMNDELNKGDIEEAKAISKDIKQNLEKINHHGKRADAIVKGMLQHSRSSSGQKEPTDINALADEYLRLAYHGLRAKDKSFNAILNTDFDESIGKIEIVAQDIGRVILNLITNAFYAVDEKKKMGLANYEPTVSVTTQKIGDKVLITVKDNGNGIPDAIKEKIFQPFFTTKPTGQGTGLGLSLAYDIVKAHGGELTVETKEVRPDNSVELGVGTTFIIQLPLL